MKARRNEAIELEFTSHNAETGDPVMMIVGQTEAVMQVAQELQDKGMVKSFLHSQDKRINEPRGKVVGKVKITFRMKVDASNNMAVFNYIHDRAWAILDPRGQK